MTRPRGSILNVAYAVDDEGRLVLSPDSALNITANNLNINTDDVEALLTDIENSIGPPDPNPNANTLQGRIQQAINLLTTISSNTGSVTTNGLTDAELRASPVSVSISGGQVEVANDIGNPLPISGTVTANIGTISTIATAANQTDLISRIGEVATNPTANTVLARLKSIQDGISSITSGSVSLNTNITGGVSNGLTDTQLRATPVPVTISNSQVEVVNDVGNPLPVSGTVAISNTSIQVTASSSTPVSVSLATTTEAKLDSIISQLVALTAITNPEKLDWPSVTLSSQTAGTPWITSAYPGTTIFSLGLTVTSIGTNIIVRIEGSTDDVNYFNLAADEADSIITANGTYGFNFTGKLKRIRARVITITGGTPSAVFTLLTG